MDYQNGPRQLEIGYRAEGILFTVFFVLPFFSLKVDLTLWTIRLINKLMT